MYTSLARFSSINGDENYNKSYTVLNHQKIKPLNWDKIYVLIIIIILVSGIFFRVDGYKNHVTYIDELMILSEGQWNSNGKEYSYHSNSSYEFTKKLFDARGVSYAPLQFLATYQFVKGARPLSKIALEQARIPSVIAGILSLIFMFLLLYEINNRKITSAILLPLSLYSSAQIYIINSQQAHPYMLGVFAFIFLIYSLLIIIKSKNILLCGALSIIFMLLPFSNYLLIPIVVSFVAIAWFYIAFPEKKSITYYKLSIFKILFLIPAFGLSIAFAVWTLEHKASMSIPWWVQSFKMKEFYSSTAALTHELITNIYYTLESMFKIGGMKSANTLILSVFFMLSIIGFVSFAHLVKSNIRIFKNQSLFPLLCTLFTFLIFISLFFFKKMAISPSRHMLIFGAASVILLFYSISFFYTVLDRYHIGKWHMNVFNTTVAIFVLIFSALQYKTFSYNKQESFNAKKIVTLAEENDVKTIATDYYSYDKFYIFLEPYILSDKIELVILEGDESKLPKKKFLVVGQDTLKFRYLYNGQRYKRYRSNLIYESRKEYDFEPSDKISYWPNQMKAYLFEPTQKQI